MAAWLLGIGAPLLAAVIWGAMVAPKARWRLPRPVRVVVELGLFGVGAGALAVAGRPVLALVLSGAALATSLLNGPQNAGRGPTLHPGRCPLESGVGHRQ